MTSIILPILLIFSSPDTGTLYGNVTSSKNYGGFPGVSIMLYQNGRLINGTVSKGNGDYMLQGITPGQYDVKYYFLGYLKKTIKDVCIDSSNTIALDVFYPNTCKKSSKVCPLNHDDHILPIKYGIASLKMTSQANAGKLYLGGCRQSDCDPTWHCSVHDIQF